MQKLHDTPAPRRVREKRTASGLIVREAEYGPTKGRDRNRPCPCGSGRKTKRCHGRNA